MQTKKVTEEDVSISKERKMCIVCKGKIGRLNIMCAECGAFYCKNVQTRLYLLRMHAEFVLSP